ncbi:hypothetical protein T459_28259 [Capsicum annuum]|uniref:Uncharacterized protein n=1 Tax=Capsicum annuum TaxID=4072 RepID=A0A2G2YGA0_CAPAN|nr:hypothetical protein T459_28259 [Capsicum annuum]
MLGRKILTRDDLTVLTPRPIPFPKQQKVNLGPGYRGSKGDQAEYDTSNCEEDLKAQSLMRQLLYNQKLQAACPVLFDEAKLWKGLKQQIQKQFRIIRNLQNNEFSGPLPPSFKSLNKLTYLDLSFNSLFGAIPEAANNSLNYITTLDCVGCEKCRLWAKLVLGIGIALKILFSVDGESRHDQHEMSPAFEKTTKGKSLQPTAKLISSWRRLWETVVKDRNNAGDQI